MKSLEVLKMRYETDQTRGAYVWISAADLSKIRDFLDSTADSQATTELIVHHYMRCEIAEFLLDLVED